MDTLGFAVVGLGMGANRARQVVATTTFPESQPPTVEIRGTQGGVILAGDQITYWETDQGLRPPRAVPPHLRGTGYGANVA